VRRWLTTVARQVGVPADRNPPGADLHLSDLWRVGGRRVRYLAAVGYSALIIVLTLIALSAYLCGALHLPIDATGQRQQLGNVVYLGIAWWPMLLFGVMVMTPACFSEETNVRLFGLHRVRLPMRANRWYGIGVTLTGAGFGGIAAAVTGTGGSRVLLGVLAGLAAGVLLALLVIVGRELARRSWTPTEGRSVHRRETLRQGLAGDVLTILVAAPPGGVRTAAGASHHAVRAGRRAGAVGGTRYRARRGAADRSDTPWPRYALAVKLAARAGRLPPRQRSFSTGRTALVCSAPAI
jgi:hypothetical protein